MVKEYEKDKRFFFHHGWWRASNTPSLQREDRASVVPIAVSDMASGPDHALQTTAGRMFVANMPPLHLALSDMNTLTKYSYTLRHRTPLDIDASLAALRDPTTAKNVRVIMLFNDSAGTYTGRPRYYGLSQAQADEAIASYEKEEKKKKDKERQRQVAPLPPPRPPRKPGKKRALLSPTESDETHQSAAKRPRVVYPEIQRDTRLFPEATPGTVALPGPDFEDETRVWERAPPVDDDVMDLPLQPLIPNVVEEVERTEAPAVPGQDLTGWGEIWGPASDEEDDEEDEEEDDPVALPITLPIALPAPTPAPAPPLPPLPAPVVLPLAPTPVATPAPAPPLPPAEPVLLPAPVAGPLAPMPVAIPAPAPPPAPTPAPPLAPEQFVRYITMGKDVANLQPELARRKDHIGAEAHLNALRAELARTDHADPLEQIAVLHRIVHQFEVAHPPTELEQLKKMARLLERLNTERAQLHDRVQAHAETLGAVEYSVKIAPRPPPCAQCHQPCVPMIPVEGVAWCAACEARCYVCRLAHTGPCSQI